MWPVQPLLTHLALCAYLVLYLNRGGGGYGSESEGEEPADSRVTLPQNVPGRGNAKAQQSAIRLTEVLKKLALVLTYFLVCLLDFILLVCLLACIQRCLYSTSHEVDGILSFLVGYRNTMYIVSAFSLGHECAFSLLRLKKECVQEKFSFMNMVRVKILC